MFKRIEQGEHVVTINIWQFNIAMEAMAHFR